MCLNHFSNLDDGAIALAQSSNLALALEIPRTHSVPV
mgnify:CR=1 FL=1